MHRQWAVWTEDGRIFSEEGGKLLTVRENVDPEVPGHLLTLHENYLLEVAPAGKVSFEFLVPP